MFLSSSISGLKIIRNSERCFSFFGKAFVANMRVNFGRSVKNLCITTESEFKKDIIGSVQSELDGSEMGKTELVNLNTSEEDYNYDECFKEIAQGDPNVEKQLKKLQFEIALMRSRNYQIPKIVTEADWRKLLEINSVRQRTKFLKFLSLNEYKASNTKRKIQRRRLLGIQKLEELSHGDFVYGVGFNSLFIRVYLKSMTYFAYEKMLRALMFSQHVVFDCSYEEYMSDLNSRYCAHQIATSICDSKFHPFPFHVKLCNLKSESKVYRNLKGFAPNIEKDFFPWDIHEGSYLDFYPKEKIVYLTPHTKKILHNYSHDDVYVIGAFVDKGQSVKASLAKAKENNLRMAKFPLDIYLKWKKGKKSLPLNLVLKILLDMRLYNSWRKAFKHIPSRFLQPIKTRKVRY